MLFPFTIEAQQIPDTAYHPKLLSTEYTFSQGPVILIDEGHHNFHTKDGRYQPFASLLTQDGYQVKSYTGSISSNKLALGKILVISNALHESNVGHWYLPTPSAFTAEEIEELRRWVLRGGRLFLIADHMPLAGAAKDLAQVFGFEMSNGFVFHDSTEGVGYFNTVDGSLKQNIITQGRNKNEEINHIVTFTGQGFKIPEDAQSILTFDSKYYNLMPDTAWAFHSSTPRASVSGWSQGAFKEYGKGKIVVFGEAAMFTAQLAGAELKKIGMNAESAGENYQLLLNIIHWLDPSRQ